MRRKWHTGQDEDKSGKTSTPPFPCAASASIPLGKDVHCTPVLKARPIQEGCRHVPPSGFPDDLCDMTENPLLKVCSLSEIPSRGFSDVLYVSSPVCLCQYAAVERHSCPTASFLVQDGICVGRKSDSACMTPEKVTALQCAPDG